MKCPGCQTDNPPTSRFCPDCGTPLVQTRAGPSIHDTRTIPPVRDLETGTLFAGRYQIIEKIGAGGMGRVFKVFDNQIRERIALKILKPEIDFDEKSLDRFRTEIRLARRISHKNVCRMFDLGEFSGIHYLTMEHVPGESLKSIIRMTAPLSVATAVHYAKEICEGLEEAHRWDIIHRDLKPQNIMIDPTGTVRIMDFGIARSLQPAGHTELGLAVGSPEYMSPEQAEGQDIDPRADIYALGIVLYEMVTGKVPFEGDTTLAILRKQEAQKPQPPRELNSLVPERLDRLILKCLEKDRARRCQNAREVLQELGAIQTGTQKAVGGRARTPRKSRALEPGRRAARRAAGLGLTVLALAAGGYLGLRYLIPGRPSPLPPPRSAIIPESDQYVAILPFNVSLGDPKFANLGRDLADSLRTRLAMSGAKVLSSYSSEVIQKSENRPDEIRRANVGRYLQGGLRIDEGIVSISVSLVDTAGESIAWARDYVEKLDGIYSDVPDRIAMDVARKLRTSIGFERLHALRRQGTNNLDAYIAVVNARESTRLYGRSEREEDFTQALGLLRSAIGLDRNYALAYRGLGDLYEIRFVATGEKADLEAMTEAYRKANDIDPAIPQVHAGLGWAYFHQEKFDQAYKAFKTALSYDPADPVANRDAGSFLRSIGLDEPALRHYQLATEGDPLEPLTYYLAASSALNLGDYGMAEANLLQSLALRPDDPTVRQVYARLLLMLGRLDDAEKEMKALEEGSANSPALKRGLENRRALLLAVKGERDNALALISGCREPYRFEITNACCVLGMNAEAVRLIKMGNENGFRLIKDYLYAYPYLVTNPFFKSLAGDPGFQAVVRNEKAAYEAKLLKYGDL